jgi:hypothetical protein
MRQRVVGRTIGRLRVGQRQLALRRVVGVHLGVVALVPSLLLLLVLPLLVYEELARFRVLGTDPRVLAILYGRGGDNLVCALVSGGGWVLCATF